MNFVVLFVFLGGGSKMFPILSHANRAKQTFFPFMLCRDECEISFYPARRFSFHHQNFEPAGNLVAEARVSDEPMEQGRGIDPYSLQLILSAVYKNFIYRPLKAFGNFIIVTKSIFFDPSTRIEEKYLIS